MVMVFSHGSILLLALPLLLQVTCAFVEIAPKNQIYSNYYNSKPNTPSPTVVGSTSFPQDTLPWNPWKKNLRSFDLLSSRATSSSETGTSGTNQDENSSNSVLEVVLFGVGDLRIHDHEGLRRAMSKCHESIDSTTSSHKILFLFVLDEDLLRNIPGMSIHTIDTATILWSALQSMDQSLRQLFCNTTTSTATPSMIQFYVGNTCSCIETLIVPSSAFRSVTIHVCDLGEADISMQYNPYSALLPFLDENNHLQKSAGSPTTTASSSFITATTTTVKPWTSRLRQEPWEQLSTLPDTFAEYRDTFITSARTINQPLPTPLLQKQTNLKSVVDLPNSTQFTSLEEWISFITKHVDDTRNTTLESERHTGLFGTHWGSIRPNYCSEHDVHSCWDVYNGKEEEFWKSRWYQSRCIVAQQPNTYDNNKLYGNERSLEHAAINWMLNNNINNNNNPEDAIPTTAITTTQNLMDGELFLRYMAAPLLFGCISIRQLHYYAITRQTPNGYKNKNSSNNRWLLSNMPSLSSSAKTFRSLLTAAESREWHNLFAASCLLKQRLKYQYKKETTTFQYWRWQGFLCRYITTASTSSTGSKTFPTTTSTHNDETSRTTTSNRHKLGLVLLHGFGASGGQWEKMITEIYQRWDIDTIPHRKVDEGYDDTTSSSTSRPKPLWSSNDFITFAPDLIGFGQSEKPFITYTQYLWESYASAFVKEIVLQRRRMATTVAEGSTVQNYIIGGNSIGGYTAMACAADDSTCTITVSSDTTVANTASEENTIVATASGSPGIGRCIGLVLFNSAGRILTKQEIEGQQLTVGPSLSIAQATSQRKLPKCSPPPALVASLGGQGLLWYLRPRIQSICVNLYPSNPSAADDNLCTNILRDSLDPGALAVMISGSKLPPPRTANELLGASFGSSSGSTTRKVGENDTVRVIEGQWSGPVLIAQGMKDPLNDAVGRAKMFQSLRQGIEIAPLDGGHCPHDELPREAAHAVCDWMIRTVNYAQ